MANRNVEHIVTQRLGSQIIYRSKDHNKREKVKSSNAIEYKFNRYNVAKNYLVLLKNGTVIEIIQKLNSRCEHVVKNKKKKVIKHYIIDRNVRPADSITFRILSRVDNITKKRTSYANKKIVDKFLAEANEYFNRKVKNIDKE